MLLKIMFCVLVSLCYGQCAFVYSSFWAPLFNPRILNYRVDAKFDTEKGKSDRAEFERNYGYRGQQLIANLGNGKGPSQQLQDQDHKYEDVKFYYTYEGANSIV